jgi:hypothetical protein
MPSHRIPAVTLALAAVLAACQSESTTPSTDLPASVAQDVADVVTTDQEALLDASTLDPSTGVAVASPAASSPPPCTPGVSPSPPANSDGDMVPDSARFDFTGCSFTRGNYSFVLSGLIDILDPTAAEDGFGIKAGFIGFTRERTFVPTSRVTTAVFNGIRQVSGNSDAINHLITDFHTDVTLPRGRTVSHVKDWNATFTADQPGSIAHGQPVPSGTLNVAGSSAWSRGDNEVFSMSITTSGLHYNAACTVAPRFDAGSSMLVVTRRGETTNVLIEHTACGQYTVTRS